MPNVVHLLLPLLLLLPVPAAATPADDTVFLVMVDGVAWPTFSRVYDEGHLPTMRGLLEPEGRVPLHHVSSFPSSTIPVIPELFSGNYIDRAGPDIALRVQELNRDDGRILRYAFNPPAWDSRDDDLFTLVKRTGRQGWCWFEGFFGDASLYDIKPRDFKRMYLAGNLRIGLTGYDHRIASRVAATIREADAPPALVFICFATADVAGHAWRPEDPRYGDAITAIDAELGRIVAALQERSHAAGGSWYDHTTFFVFGDHGMAGSTGRFRVDAALAKIGVRAYDTGDVPTIARATFRKSHWMDRADTISLAIGSNASDVHVRAHAADGTRLPWSTRPSLDQMMNYPIVKGGTANLPRAMAERPEVQVVVAADGIGRVRVFGSGGAEARVTRDASRHIAYEVIATDASGRDPFGYLQVPSALPLITPKGSSDVVFSTEKVWRYATAGAQFPDAPPLLPKAVLGNPRAPDMVVTLKPGWGALPITRADHGSLDTISATSFLVASGPDLCIPDPTAPRLLDVNAEVRRVLGLPIEPGLDSQGLCPVSPPQSSETP